VLVSTALDIFDSEVFRGPHPPLVLGWRDDQLAPVVELLNPFLPSHLPDKPEKGITPAMKRAIAACACSITLSCWLTGQPVRYSRNRNHYGGATRYWQGDCFYTWHFVTNAVDVLHQTGLIGHALGEWLGSGAGGRQSVAWATDGLMALLGPLINSEERRGDWQGAEVIVLRDSEDKHDIDYEDTEETNAMRIQVQALNDALGELELFLHGRRFPIPLLRRIGNGDFGRGCRFYHHGPSHQNIPAEERRNLQLLIDGVLHWMVEVDYAPGAVYRISGAFRTATQIVFGPDEAIRHVAIGDSVSWEVAAEGSVLFLKPRERLKATNLLVVTERGGATRHYAFELAARDARDRSSIAYQIRFRYPADLQAATVASLDAAAEAIGDRVIDLALDQAALSGPGGRRNRCAGKHL
jgi:hypothetical protein